MAKNDSATSTAMLSVMIAVITIGLSGCSNKAKEAAEQAPPPPATAGKPSVEEGYLEGTWVVRCPNGHDDQVSDHTVNHTCEKCGAKTVDNGSAIVLCTEGHANFVHGITKSKTCTAKLANGKTCGKPCRR